MQKSIITLVGLFVSRALGLSSSVPFINADDAHHQGTTGLGVTVAVIDTGIDYGHPGLAGSIAVGGASFENGVLQPDPGEDVYGYGHGTYMSLIITDDLGVAHDARILPVRVFGPLGATVEDAITGINYVRLLRVVDPSLRVINLSLGTITHYPCQCDAWWPAYEAAIAAAQAAGIITFAATGNDGACGGISAPACLSSAVKVAASYDAQYPTTDFGDCGDFAPPAYRITCFSNITEDCNYLLAAPGYSITVGGFHGDGTSQATAHTSGVAALMFDKSGPCGSI